MTEYLVFGFSALFALTVATPILRASYRRAARESERELYLVKLKLIRQFHPELEGLSYGEIDRTYDVRHAYEQLGDPRVLHARRNFNR